MQNRRGFIASLMVGVSGATAVCTAAMPKRNTEPLTRREEGYPSDEERESRSADGQRLRRRKEYSFR